MSKPWKGWMSRARFHAGSEEDRHILYRHPGHWADSDPVIVTPIDDESLPHPGDGKEWELKYDDQLVEPLTPPVGRSGKIIVRGRNGAEYTVLARNLRERKPEPEHRPHCPLSKPLLSGHCRCERRSGEERRTGERRKEWPYWVSLADRRHEYGGDLVRAKRGGRSGEDRRHP